MFSLLLLVANSLLHFFSILCAKLTTYRPWPYIVSFNGKKCETASSERALLSVTDQWTKKKSITSELSNKFVFSNSDRILKKYPVFGEKVKAWNIISTDKELKLAIFSTDAYKFKHFNIRKNKTAPNSVDFVLKSIKHLLDIGYMKKNLSARLLLLTKINK